MPERTEELQRRLASYGLDSGPFDGIYGELTEEAVFDALDRYAPAYEQPSGLVPIEWMPAAAMTRIVTHWTAGAWKASDHDKNYYHLLIEDDGRLVRGVYSIKDNQDTSDGRYAGHTKNLNTGSIGISVCCMANATQSPFSAGKYPMTEAQWNTLAEVVAELCDTYTIIVTRETVLSHAEVQPTLGVAQSGKWDIMWIPGMTASKDPVGIGDQFRKAVAAKL